MALLQALMPAQRVLPGLYNPTGISFEQPGGDVSTELNMIFGGGDEPYRLLPTLVPGQRGIESILGGKSKLTPEQLAIILHYAKGRASEVPTFRTLDEAKNYERRRHIGLERGYLPSSKEDVLKSLYQLLGVLHE